ncbi:hypothetical protein [Microbacterium oxydans]|uniref:hypothetical protein n=1 Tax=Microbacterium oxydans TaxID=82380 RepID=UPI0024ACCAB4|nr:hypothetical protein [Microbacterium oxydans]
MTAYDVTVPMWLGDCAANAAECTFTVDMATLGDATTVPGGSIDWPQTVVADAPAGYSFDALQGTILTVHVSTHEPPTGNATYTITDTAGNTASARIFLPTIPVAPPVVTDKSFWMFGLGCVDFTDCQLPNPDTMLFVYPYPDLTIDLLADATATAPATIDPATVELSPSSDPTAGWTATVDANGILTITTTVTPGQQMTYAEMTARLASLSFTVKDSVGNTSNAATITGRWTPPSNPP